MVSILTNGSGSDPRGPSRQRTTTRILDSLDARRGSIHGAMSDACVYQAIMRVDIPFFIQLLDTLADDFARAGTQRVVCDGFEEYNPTHDLAHMLAIAAMRLANPRGQVFDFSLVGAPVESLGALRFPLDPLMFERKVAAARAYRELSHEVAEAEAGVGIDEFRAEWLRPVSNWPRIDTPETHKPHYELFGEQRVSKGTYRDVLRRQAHFRPLAEALITHTEKHERA